MPINLGTLNAAKIFSGVGGHAPNVFNGADCILYPVDDNSVALLAATIDTNPTPPHRNAFYVIDASGSFTYYSTAFQNQNYFSSIVPLGVGIFLITMDTGITYYLTLKNQKLNNASPILIMPGIPLSNSCAANDTLNGVFYDGTQDLVAAAFYPGFAACSSIYEVNSNNGQLQLINQGYVGPTNFSNPFNLLQLTQPSNTRFTAWTANGLYVAIGGTGGENIFASRTGVFINSGNVTNNCNTPNGSYVTARPNGLTLFTTTAYGPNFWHLNSNIPGLFGTSDSSPPAYQSLCNVFGDGVWFQFNYEIPGGAYAARAENVVITKNHVFGVGTDAATSANNAVYVAASPGFYNGPSGVSQRSFHLVNNTRPISVTGRYKA